MKLEIDTTDERNQTNSNNLDVRPRNNNVRNSPDGNDHMRVDTEEIREELKYTLLDTNSSALRPGPYATAVVASVFLLLLLARV